MTNRINDSSWYTETLQGYQQKQLEQINNWLKWLEPRNVLDAGCGPGVLTHHLRDSYEWTGLDISPVAKEFHGKGIIGSIDSMPFDNQSFDVSLCIDVLEHLDDNLFERAIRELGRVTRNAIIIMVPNEPSLKTLSLVCPNCGEVFHSNGHVKNVLFEDINSILTQDGFTLADKAYIGDSFPDGIAIRELLFQKRFWEQILNYPYKCPKCNQVISEFFSGVQKEELLLSYYRILKPLWFDALKDSSILQSEKVYLWVRGKELTAKYSDKERDIKKSSKHIIDPSIDLCIVDSPYALPLCSYIVLEKTIIKRVTDYSLSYIPLSEGDYKLFFASYCSGFCIVGEVKEPIVLKIKWIDRNDQWHTQEVQLNIVGEIKETILFCKEPKIDIEGIYVEVNICSQLEDNTDLLHVQKIEAITSYPESRRNALLQEHSIWPAIFLGQLELIKNLLACNKISEANQTSPCNLNVEQLLEQQTKKDYELECWRSVTEKSYQNIESLQIEVQRLSEQINLWEETTRQAYQKIELLEDELERKTREVENLECIIRELYETVEEIQSKNKHKINENLKAKLIRAYWQLGKKLPPKIKDVIKKLLKSFRRY